jgi:hypothetical protein
MTRSKLLASSNAAPPTAQPTSNATLPLAPVIHHHGQDNVHHGRLETVHQPQHVGDVNDKHKFKLVMAQAEA